MVIMAIMMVVVVYCHQNPIEARAFKYLAMKDLTAELLKRFMPSIPSFGQMSGLLFAAL